MRKRSRTGFNTMKIISLISFDIAERKNHLPGAGKAGRGHSCHRRVRNQHTRTATSIRPKFSYHFHWLVRHWFYNICFLVLSSDMAAACHLLVATIFYSDRVSY